MSHAYAPGEAWDLAKEAIKRGDVAEAERLITHMLPSDQRLMREKIEKYADANRGV